MTRIGPWPPCTTSRPLAFSSSRLPASTNSPLGTSISLAPGALSYLNISSHSGKRVRLAAGFALDGQFARQQSRAAHVRFGSEADILGGLPDVRFTPKS